MKFKVNQLPIIVLGVFLIESVSGLSKCPYVCRCNKTSISCIEKNIEEIPKFISMRPTVDQMDFSNNEIHELKNDSFAFIGSSQINIIKLNANSIMEIESHTFYGLINLELLDIHDNLLGNVPSNIVKNNKNLIVLNLSENLFTKKTPVIESESLESLDLSYTRISTFSEENIKHLPNLRLLQLFQNHLTYIDPIIFVERKSFYVDLAHNLWHCNCNTTKIFQILTNKNLTKVDKIQCKLEDIYLDIFDERGPIFSEQTCSSNENAIASKHHILNNITTPEYLQNTCNDFFCNTVNYTIVLSVSILTIIILLGIILMAILFKIRRYEKVETSYEMESTSC